MVYDFLEGKIDEALKKQLDCLPLVNSLFSEVNPIPVKAALNIKGYNFGIPRLPLIPMSAEKEENLKKVMKNFNI